MACESPKVLFNIYVDDSDSVSQNLQGLPKSTLPILKIALDEPANATTATTMRR